MIKYPSIDGVWKRGEDGKIIPGQLRKPEHMEIARWFVTEKVDGTNIRVILGMTEEGRPTFEVRGRTDKAQLAGELKDNIFEQLYAPQTYEILGITPEIPKTVTLYGEGYGPGIQKGGGLYRADKGFIMFDVREGNMEQGRFLDYYEMRTLARLLLVDTVPFVGILELDEVPMDRESLADLVPASYIPGANREAEGVVARPRYELLNKYGERMMWKAVFRDFDALNTDS